MGLRAAKLTFGRASAAAAQTDHDWMVEQMVEAYSGLGHADIRAVHHDQVARTPARLGMHVPDITAMAGHTQIPIICEIETVDSMNRDEARSRFITFRRAADTVGGVLHVGVPFRSDLDSVKRIAASWGVLVDQWWYGVAL